MKVLGAAFVATSLVVTSGLALAQDAAKGEKVFSQCKACHALDKALVGPALGGVIGRKAGTASGYSYSGLMKAAGEAGLTWNAAELTDYLKNPTKYLQMYVKDKGKSASGSSKMVFMLANETQRKDVAAYLEKQK